MYEIDLDISRMTETTLYFSYGYNYNESKTLVCFEIICVACAISTNKKNLK